MLWGGGNPSADAPQASNNISQVSNNGSSSTLNKPTAGQPTVTTDVKPTPSTGQEEQTGINQGSTAKPEADTPDQPSDRNGDPVDKTTQNDTPDQLSDGNGNTADEKTQTNTPESQQAQKISNDLRKMSDEDFEKMKTSLQNSMFIEEVQGEITYNLEKVKKYLEPLKNKERKDLKSKLGNPEGIARISAVQILLNEHIQEDDKKINVDGKLSQETKNAVINFQKKYNQEADEKGGVKLSVDGGPGKDTLSVLLDGKLGDTILEGKRKVDQNGQITFLDGTEIKEKNGRKYIEVDGKQYYEWRSGMNGLGYIYGINHNYYGCLFVGNFKKGAAEGQGTMTWADGVKYEGNCKKNKREGQGTYTWANGNKYVGQWKNDERTKGTFILNPGDNEVKYEVDRIDGKSVIISGGDGSMNGKYVSYGEIVDSWPDS